MSEEKEIPVNSTEETGEPQPEATGTDKKAPADGEKVGAADLSNEELGEEAAQRIGELEDRLLRTVAEFDNYKKRTANQFEQMVRSANEKLLLELLDVVDNFERALQHSNGESENESLRKGTELIYNQLLGILAKYDVKPIESVGQPFDPNLHEAMMQTPSNDYDEGLVAMEIGKGYVLGERVLRHAKVAVSTGPTSPEANQEDQ